MTKYLYVVNVEASFAEAELPSVKYEICRLFDCTEIAVSGSTLFTVHSPLAPSRLDAVVRELSSKFRVEFKAGGRMH